MKRVLRLLLSMALVIAATIGTGTAAMAQNIGTIVYDFGGYTIPAGMPQQFTVDSATLTGMLAKNSDGSFALDAAGNFYADNAVVSSFVSTLAGMYNVPGTAVLNQDIEKQYISAIISSGATDLSHKPTFTLTASLPNGGTYIDVNLTTQTLNYYVSGVVTLTSPVVTGNVSLGRETPEGVYYIYTKQTDRILKGPNYASHVDYWMPFYKGYGLHDANWRSKFGGTIYQNSGSHGCVNMPHDNAALLYSTVNVGTPVIVHK